MARTPLCPISSAATIRSLLVTPSSFASSITLIFVAATSPSPPTSQCRDRPPPSTDFRPARSTPVPHPARHAARNACPSRPASSCAPRSRARRTRTRPGPAGLLPVHDHDPVGAPYEPHQRSLRTALPASETRAGRDMAHASLDGGSGSAPADSAPVAGAAAAAAASAAAAHGPRSTPRPPHRSCRRWSPTSAQRAQRLATGVDDRPRASRTRPPPAPRRPRGVPPATRVSAERASSASRPLALDLGLALDVDAHAGQLGGQPRVLALLADGQRELVVGHDHQRGRLALALGPRRSSPTRPWPATARAPRTWRDRATTR